MKTSLIIIALLLARFVVAQTNIQLNTFTDVCGIFPKAINYPAHFQLNSNFDTTNIVISADYKGTIQMGARTIGVEEIKQILDDRARLNVFEKLVENTNNVVGVGPNCTDERYSDDGQGMPLPPEITTNWIGHPMVSDNDPYTPSEAWLPHIEEGLRSDGIVVWRSVK